MPETPDWSAVISNFNGEGVILAAVRSLQALDHPPDEIIVVDDGSTDRSLELVAESFPDVILLPLGRNTRRLNLVRNTGAEAAKHRYVLITDNDIHFAPDAVDKLLTVLLEREDATACTPLVLYGDDPTTVYSQGHELHFLCWSIKRTAPTLAAAESEGVHRTVGVGIQMVDKAHALQTGLFDAGLPLGWGDDGEFHHRLRLLGRPCYTVPTAHVYHGRVRKAARYYGQIHNRFIIILKCYALRTLVICAPALILFELMLILYVAAVGDGRGYLRAIGDIYRNRESILRDRRRIQSARTCQDRTALGAGDLDIAAYSTVGGAVRGVVDASSLFFRGYWQLARRLL